MNSSVDMLRNDGGIIDENHVKNLGKIVLMSTNMYPCVFSYSPGFLRHHMSKVNLKNGLHGHVSRLH